MISGIFIRRDGFLALVAICLAGVAMALVWPHLEGRMHYSEFVVGPSTLTDSEKGKDKKVVLGFIVVAAIAFAIARRLVKQPVAPYMSKNLGVYLILFATFLPWAGSALAVMPREVPEAWIMTVLASGLLFLTSMCSSKIKGADALVPFYGLSAGGLFFSLFSGFGLICSASLVFPDIIIHQMWLCHTLTFGPFVFMLLCLTAMLVFAPAGSINRFQRSWFLFAQCGLPLLAVAVIPERIMYEGIWQGMQIKPALLGLVAGFIVLSGFALFRRRHIQSTARGLVSPWSIASIAIYMAAGPPGYPSISQDHFHFGEQILPWMQWNVHDKVPFVDFFPFHGWMHLLTGAVSHIFYGNGISGFRDAQLLIFSFSAAVTALLVMRLCGASLGVVTAMFFLPVTFYAGRLVFVAPVLLGLALPWLCSRPAWWLAAWVAGSGFLVLYNTVSGAAFALGSLPFACWMLWRCRAGYLRELSVLVSMVCLLGLVIYFTPIRHVASGYISFILENRPSYDIVQGRPWAESFGLTPVSGGLLSYYPSFEVLRNGWVLLAFLALYVVFYVDRPSAKHERFSRLYASAGVSAMLYFLMDYTLGRIDKGSPGRQGTLTYLLVFTWLPLMMVNHLKIPVNITLSILLFLAGIMTGLMQSESRWQLRSLFWQSMRGIATPANMIRVPADEPGKENLAGVYLTQDQWGELREFNRALSLVTFEDQTFADFTGRQAYYVYTGKPVPITHGAMANVDNSIKQAFVKRQFMENPPPAVWIHPRLIYDLDLNVRSYDVWRHVMLSYEPVRAGEHIFMVNEFSPAFTNALRGEAKVRLLCESFTLRNLERLPQAWGRSWSDLERLAVRVVSPAVDESRPGLFSVMISDPHADGLNFSGRLADLLVLRVSHDRSPGDGEFIVRWVSEYGVSDECRFKGVGDVLVVPIGMFPDWLLADNICSLEVEASVGAKILGVSLWQRNLPYGS